MYDFINSFSDEFVKLAKTYPVSRALSWIVPWGRSTGAKGLLGRLRAGTVTNQDMRSIRRILIEKRKLSFDKAEAAAKKIIEASKAGKLAGGKQHQWARFSTSRAAQAATLGGAEALSTAMLTTPITMLGGGAALPLALTAGSAAKGALTAAGSTQLMRAIGPRGLAGRIAKGKKLRKAERQLMETLEPPMKKKLKAAVARIKATGKAAKAKVRKKLEAVSSA